jgi:hypothetical protein
MTPPAPSAAKSPVEFFRELLAMEPAERRAALANRTGEDRDSILAKVREYLALKPDQRELRLHATELSWYLSRLMRTPATNRPAQLAQVPDSVRKPIEDRLVVWDKLAPEIQKEFLDNRLALQYFTELAAGIPQPAMTNISPTRREVLERGIREFQAMPELQRQKLLVRFKEYFDLTVVEKQRALNTISEPERQAMEKTLRNFGQLTPEQRSACIHSFEKFAGMSIPERNQFLKNAERWKLMTPQQRKTWREVVSEVVLLPTVPETPPIPRAVPPRRTPPLIVTNGNFGR